MHKKTLGDLYVLLVEPSTSQAKYIHRELKEAGVTHFEIATDGQSANDVMRKFSPDLVISSMYLPDMTAIELIHKIREDEALEDIAFMLISSETGFNYIDPIKQAGVSAILPKPFTSDQLKRGLYNSLDILNPEELELGEYNIEDLSVLIVDDSSLARKCIARELKGLGIENITEADDGESAVPLLEEHFYDFVVTDYNMPHMDGKELIKYIRSKSNQQSIPVLMVTSEGDKGQLAAIEQAGVSGICDKPFESDTVRTLIQTMMSDI